MSITDATYDRVAPPRAFDGQAPEVSPHRDDGGPAPVAAPVPGRFSPRRVSRNGWITVAIGVLAAVAYTWNLAANGWANDYYAAAVRSMSQDWKAFFFGSIDTGNFITVDKPPAALWLQALSARVFGFSSLSMLLPEALCGVASVLILHRLVRRWAGDTAAHLAALGFALTPVAVLMFRFNNPDALLTLLCLGAAWAMWSAVETGRTRWLVAAAALIGLAFNTKMLQAFVVLPAFVLVYLVAGPPKLGKRLLQLLAALVTLVVSAGWWVAAVALWPADQRPYIGSTDDNNILSLVFGYNGLSRLFGNGGPGGATGGPVGGPGGPGGGGPNFGGSAGWLRLFNGENAGQISWLIPMALAGLLAGVWLTRRGRRTDLGRAGWILWGGWAVTTYLVFSKSQGIFHPYYSVQLAPAVAACAGAGAVALWYLGRRHRFMAWALPAAIVLTGGWAVVLLNQTPDYAPWLRTAVLAATTFGAIGIFVGATLRRRGLVAVAATVAAIAILAGPATYSINTIRSVQNGPVVSAGPSNGAVGRGGPMGAPGDGGSVGPDGSTGTLPQPTGLGPNASPADPALISYLQANRGDATWVAAAFGSTSSSSIIIASGDPVMTIGGFSGGDPSPTLDEFRQLVADGDVRFVLVGGGGPGGLGGPGAGPGAGPGGGPGGNGTSSAIRTWVQQNGTEVPAAAYGGSGTGVTLYDLAGAD